MVCKLYIAFVIAELFCAPRYFQDRLKWVWVHFRQLHCDLWKWTHSFTEALRPELYILFRETFSKLTLFKHVFTWSLHNWQHNPIVLVFLAICRLVCGNMDGWDSVANVPNYNCKHVKNEITWCQTCLKGFLMEMMENWNSENISQPNE